MLKKLRMKFIVINMSMVALVLIVVFTAICLINYQQSLGRVYEALDGSLGALSHGNGQIIPDAPLKQNDQLVEGSPPEIGGKRGGSDPFIPVAVYEVSAEGTLISAPSAKTTASIAEDVLTQASLVLAEVPDGSGSLDSLGLYYAKRQFSEITYLAFTDMSATNGWQTLALTLAAVGAAALAAFLIISIFFSRWALRPVEQAWTQQRRFVADASHELKTPLTVILANSSILLDHPDQSIASQSQWVESTQTEAERMQVLVSDLLLLARLDEGGTAPLQATIDLTDLVEGDLLQFESIAFERNVQLASHLDANITILGDATRLHRLTTTLIDNACKYANKGGSVSVRLQQVEHHIELIVHNTGLTISPEDLPHVFDRFYRADKARTRDDGGYGLGLAIARAVAEEHQGTLTATSTKETGTTFTARFPGSDFSLQNK